MTEHQLCDQIIEFLNYNGAYCWRTNSGAMRASYTTKSGQAKSYMVRMSRAGTSDILGIYKGHFIAIEVKLPKTIKNVTEAQKMFLQAIKDHGGIAGVATTPEDALSILKSGDTL